MSEHTPLPWRLETHFPSGMHCVVTEKGDVCACGYKDKDKANAGFIVRACNSHYDLMDTLKAMVFGVKFEKLTHPAWKELIETAENLIERATEERRK